MKLNNLLPYLHAGTPDCDSCGGTGIILLEIVQGTRFPKLSICNCVGENCYVCPAEGKPPFLLYDEMSDKMIPCICNQARSHLASLLEKIKKANIPPRYQFKFLDNLDISGEGLITLMVAHDWATEMVSNFSNREIPLQGMYLSGGTGSGKTLLACTILNELIFRYNANCKYAKVNKDFLNVLKGTYQKDSEFYGQESLIELEIANVDVLVIDDFGVQKETEWANSKLYDLIDHRYESDKLTLLTSNLELSELREMGEGRIYSRLLEMTRELKLECPDYREKFHNAH
ncbi:MAG: ATP-binding protein [Leptospiraceae bacterium]|nr:ATP-binding protein [Leptospiraceae bacterium]